MGALILNNATGTPRKIIGGICYPGEENNTFPFWNRWMLYVDRCLMDGGAMA